MKHITVDFNSQKRNLIFLLAKNVLQIIVSNKTSSCPPKNSLIIRYGNSVYVLVEQKFIKIPMLLPTIYLRG